MSCVQSSPPCSQTEASHWLQWGPGQHSTGEPSAQSGSPPSQFPGEKNDLVMVITGKGRQNRSLSTEELGEGFRSRLYHTSVTSGI